MINISKYPLRIFRHFEGTSSAERAANRSSRSTSSEREDFKFKRFKIKIDFKRSNVSDL